MKSLTRSIAGLAVLTLVFAVGGCGKDGGQQGADAQAAQSKDKHGNGNGRPAQPPIPIAVTAANIGSIASYYTATATLTAEKEAEVLARVAGIITALDCEEGDLVTAGSTLLRIEDVEYRLRLTQAVANTATQRDKFNRLKGMHDQDLVSAEAFEAVRNDLKSAEAAEELARLTLSYTQVTAPFDGRIVRRHVDVGQNVNVATPLFAIADFDPLLAIVNVPSKEFKKLKPDQTVELSLDSDDTRLQGRIKLVSPVIDPLSGTIKITIEIRKYPRQTRPGDFAEVRIVTERRNQRTLVPKNSVFSDRGDMIVYIAAADSTAERRVVDVGFRDDANAEILNGIEKGERIVTKGQRSLKHGSPIKILEENGVAVEPVEQAGS